MQPKATQEQVDRMAAAAKRGVIWMALGAVAYFTSGGVMIALRMGALGGDDGTPPVWALVLLLAAPVVLFAWFLSFCQTRRYLGRSILGGCGLLVLALSGGALLAGLVFAWEVQGRVALVLAGLVLWPGYWLFLGFYAPLQLKARVRVLTQAGFRQSP